MRFSIHSLIDILACVALIVLLFMPVVGRGPAGPGRTAHVGLHSVAGAATHNHLRLAHTRRL